MGEPNQPLNTFWQLFFERPGGSTFTDQVQATAVATNGGLVLASPGSASVIVGVRPSNRLTFSPLIATSDAGHSWSRGVLPEGLTAQPDTLARSARGQTLALVTTGGRVDVVESDGSVLTSWHTVATQASLSSVAPTCSLVSVTAVAFLAGMPVVAGSCASSSVGIFQDTATGWQRSGPAIAGAVDVLALQADGDGLSALLATRLHDQVSLSGAWAAGAGQPWTMSGPLTLPDASHVLSLGGGGGGGGMFVLVSQPSGSDRLEVVDPGKGWRALADPPAGTSTVVIGQSGAVQALAVDASMLTVWRLGAGTSLWSKTQVMNVPIEYGSSS